MQCVESLRVQAYFDGEVDAVSAAEIERHAAHCAQCRALLVDLEETRTLIHRDLSSAHATPELRSRIARALDQEAAAPARAATWLRLPVWRPRSFWAGAFSGAAGGAVAATLAFWLVFASVPQPFLDELVAAHVRSLMPSHLIDVVSTDQHTVKPWFAGRTDVSPVVADFASQGYRLIGGRAEYLDHQRAAVVVYQHAKHIINVFAWADGRRTAPHHTARNGYRMAFWQAGNVQYCAVSDTGWDELSGLVRLLQDQSARE